MVTGVLLAIAALLLAVLVSSAIARTICVYLTYRKFKKNAKGLKILPFKWSPGGHMHEFMFQRYSALLFEPLYRSFGCKTGGGMFGSTPLIATCDLELMKTVFISEANHFINRWEDIGLPIIEYEQDCIVSALGDQWRRIRKSIAPSFS